MCLSFRSVYACVPVTTWCAHGSVSHVFLCSGWGDADGACHRRKSTADHASQPSGQTSPPAPKTRPRSHNDTKPHHQCWVRYPAASNYGRWCSLLGSGQTVYLYSFVCFGRPFGLGGYHHTQTKHRFHCHKSNNQTHQAPRAQNHAHLHMQLAPAMWVLPSAETASAKRTNYID